MNRYLVSVMTPNYFSKASRYLNSLPLVTSAQPIVILLDFTPETDPEGKIEANLRSVLDWVQFRKMDLPATHSHYMVQHCFTDALPDLSDDDLIILSDMDIQIQRDLTAEEWAYLEGATASGRLSAYYNGTAADNLYLEGQRIGITEDAPPAWGGKHNEMRPCMNCGVLVGRKSTFQRMQKDYETHCDWFYNIAPHRSRCQFLINWVVQIGGYGFDLLPPTIHCHGHFMIADTGEYLLPPDTHFRLNVACYRNTPVVFKHAFPH